ncbi:MAG: DEAD/DEAH box helicase family protein [Myxococcota bacterium]
MTSRHVHNIAGRLSLRTPQKQSLEILDAVMALAEPHKKKNDIQAALAAIRAKYPSVESFERAFPSLCFALATGVGKTRLMGAFIAYLHLEHGIRHFFVLAPSLTIYNKLIADFTPNTPKYVFEGIAEFAITRPTLVTADNYEHASSAALQRQLDDSIEVNVFNIAKFNVKTNDSRKMRTERETLGQSYFDYLASLDDLVLIMDEAHRYRADTSMKSLEELKPVLGLELTATPQIESGSRSTRFKNVIFAYPLSQAMKDGFVKEPAVATRANFNPRSMSKEALEQLKLTDGVHLHEAVKVDLEVYAQENGARRVKPFMLVIAEDTAHASQLVQHIKSDAFFDGRYKDRVIDVHSGQKGAEKDENIEKLLAVESPDSPTEIVVHVNMLKEGWDVTNLYTIVPLRTADSRTLVEQSIGRGLRLPYGRRTGVTAVDRLAIVAHDRFQDIVDEAKRGGYSFSTIELGKDGDDAPLKSVFVPPRYESILGVSVPPLAPTPTNPNLPTVTPPTPVFTTPAETAVAKATLDAIARVTREPGLVPGPHALESREVQEKIVAVVTAKVGGEQLALLPTATPAGIAAVVKQATAVYIAHTIAIPRVTVLPKGLVTAGFLDFDLNLTSLRLQPISQEILVQHLASDTQERIGAIDGGPAEERLEDYVVRGLIDFDDISYDDQADLLYKLAGQVVAHLKSYLADDDQVRNVLQFNQRQIADLVHAQMQPHAWEKATSYEAVVSQGFLEVKTQAYAAPATEEVRDVRTPIDNKIDIRKMLFGGFAKCLYGTQKFDSDPERRFAVLLEKDPLVLKWFKPGKAVFKIRYTKDQDYEPDFVVETATEKLLCEPKREDYMGDEVVLAKVRAGVTWCEHATAHELAHGGKPWKYVLIPHNAIADNSTIAGLVTQYERRAPAGQ